MAKGLELPVNVLVIIVIAVVVLIAMIVLIGSNPSFSCDTEKSSGCLRLVQDCTNDPSKIKVTNFTKNGVLVDDLQEVCNQCFGKTTPTECKKLCGC